MLHYGATATIQDKNGNTIPISQSDEQEQVLNAYLAEAERYANEAAGGKYDPVLYQEYVKLAILEISDSLALCRTGELRTQSSLDKKQKDKLKEHFRNEAELNSRITHD